jgi:hypothetical protein
MLRIARRPPRNPGQFDPPARQPGLRAARSGLKFAVIAEHAQLRRVSAPISAILQNNASPRLASSGFTVAPSTFINLGLDVMSGQIYTIESAAGAMGRALACPVFQ